MHWLPLNSVKWLWDAGMRAHQPIRNWRNKRKEETVLLVATLGKTWTLQELASRAKMTEDNALQVLRGLRDKDKMMSINVDELPKETLWRRL